MPVNTVLFVCVAYCPQSDGFTYDSNRGTCFKLVAENVYWATASTRCHDQHPRAHLVVISDAAKQTAVQNFIQGEGITSYQNVGFVSESKLV